MINFHIHLSGPKMRALIAINNGERPTGIVINNLHREGLVLIMPAKSDVEGVMLDKPTLSERGRMVLNLIDGDIQNFIARLHSKKKSRGDA